MLSLRQLQLFIAIAKTGSITKAAEDLNLTQPALSGALSSLETELGEKLFDRIDRKIILNANGQLIYPKVQKLLQETELLANTFIKGQQLNGIIQIAASTTIGNYLLPPIMASFNI